MAATLETIPVELQHKVVGLVKSTADLHSLSLVSKQMSIVSASHLYKHFYFPYMNDEAAERLCNALANSNGLLLFVKTFRLGLCLRFCSDGLESAFLNLLSAFPDDCICEFNFDGHALRPSHQDFLWSHQQKIVDLELTITTEDIWWRRRINKNSLPDNGLTHELEKLQKLGFSWRNRNPALSSLRVHFLVSPKPWESDIFSQRRLPLTNIKHLSLNDMTFGGPFLDSLPHLTHLALRNCVGAGACLREFRKPILKALFFLYDPDELSVLDNLATFLSRFEGLQALSVREIWGFPERSEEQLGTQMLATSIGFHKESLNFLLIHLNFQVYRNPRDFDSIVDAATKCPNLTQLGLSLSPRRLQLCCARILDQLPSLITLRIDMEHSQTYALSLEADPINESPVYSRVIDQIADRVMEAAASITTATKLALLSFGFTIDTNFFFMGPGREAPDNWGTCDCRHSFYHSDAFVFRRNGRNAIRISAAEAKDLIPESDIIDFRERFFSCK